MSGTDSDTGSIAHTDTDGGADREAERTDLQAFRDSPPKPAVSHVALSPIGGQVEPASTDAGMVHPHPRHADRRSATVEQTAEKRP